MLAKIHDKCEYNYAGDPFGANVVPSNRGPIFQQRGGVRDRGVRRGSGDWGGESHRLQDQRDSREEAG